MISRVLVILPHGFEEIEAITPIDLLRRANISVSVVALTYPQQVVGRSRIELMAEGVLADITSQSYEAILLIGGPGTSSYFNEPLLRPFLTSHRGLMAAICAAPLVLHRFSLIKGRPYTCHSSVRKELTAALDTPVVISPGLITADGAGSAYAWSLAIIEALEGASAAQEVAEATAYRS
jgi:protein deglycase